MNSLVSESFMGSEKLAQAITDELKAALNEPGFNMAFYLAVYADF